VSVAQQQKWFLAQIAERNRVATRQPMFPRQRSEHRFCEEGKRFEFLAPHRQGKYGHIDRTGTDAFEEHGSNFFDDGDGGFGKVPGERSEHRRKKVRRDRGNHSNRHVAGDGILALNHVAASRFEFAKHRASSGKKGLTDFG
jgi:hypothetical protein